MLIHQIPIKQTSSSNGWSFNTIKIIGLLRHILVKATTAESFDFSITDATGNAIYSTVASGETPTGTLNVQVQIPLRGIYTLAVANAETASEAYTGILTVTENA